MLVGCFLDTARDLLLSDLTEEAAKKEVPETIALGLEFGGVADSCLGC